MFSFHDESDIRLHTLLLLHYIMPCLLFIEFFTRHWVYYMTATWVKLYMIIITKESETLETRHTYYITKAYLFKKADKDIFIYTQLYKGYCFHLMMSSSLFWDITPLYSHCCFSAHWDMSCHYQSLLQLQ